MGVTTRTINNKPIPTLGAGVHLVIVNSIKYARDSQNNILTKAGTGDVAIEIEFKTGKGLKISGTYWMTEKSVWLFERLCDAVEVPHKGLNSVSVRDVVSKRLFIVVGLEFEIENGILQCDTNGMMIAMPKLLPHFIKAIDPSVTPAIDGDPNLNNGVPGKKFIVNKPETLPDDFEQQYKELKARDISKPFDGNTIMDTNLPHKPF